MDKDWDGWTTGQDAWNAPGNAAPLPPALQAIRRCWDDQRTPLSLPGRDRIDPRRIGSSLEHAFVAERLAPGVARFRLSGMHLNDVMGVEVRGMPLGVLLEPSARQDFADQVEAAFARPAAVDIALEALRGIGRPALTARMILLPLRPEGDDRPQVLGGFACTGDIGRTPRRFRMTDAAASPLIVGRWPGMLRLTQSCPAGLAEPPAPRPRRGHLRLVHSADRPVAT